ncbi:MAG: hypothetical protein HC863_01745 [Myxococcales bacterium]|nr:hypothetical protein [Myxococcales bacterium]
MVGVRGERRLSYLVADQADPGYGSTCKMLGQSALCLAFDALPSAGGCLTPAKALGGALRERLRNVGMTFDLADTSAA